MRFEGSVYKPVGDEPGFFGKFLEQYQFVTKFFTEFNSNRFRFTTDVKSQTMQVPLIHGKAISIQHNLGFAPERVLFMGRVSMFTVVTSNNAVITVIPKLLTTGIVNPPFGKVVNQLTVEDTTLFRNGDVVIIGSVSRTIQSILGNVITLDKTFICDTVYVMALAVENATAILF